MHQCHIKPPLRRVWYTVICVVNDQQEGTEEKIIPCWGTKTLVLLRKQLSLKNIFGKVSAECLCNNVVELGPTVIIIQEKTVLETLLEKTFMILFQRFRWFFWDFSTFLCKHSVLKTPKNAFLRKSAHFFSCIWWYFREVFSNAFFKEGFRCFPCCINAV